MPEPDIFTLQQALQAEKEKNALLAKQNENVIDTNKALQTERAKEIADSNAKISDLKQALAIAQGQRGKNWGSKKRVDGRMG